MDESLKEQLQRKIDNLNKPKGSLGRLEGIALQIGLIQGTLSPSLQNPCHLLIGADHGIEREGVSVSPREVTWQQMVNFTHGGGAVNFFCRQHGIRLKIVDVGVDHDLSAHPKIMNRKISQHGTRDFLDESAMSHEEMECCMKTGRQLAEECAAEGCNILSLGEMGIGNTSASSMWMHLLTGIPIERCVGAGSGLNESGVRHKLDVLNRCLCRACPTNVERVMAEFGGLEMVTAVGAMLRGKELGMTLLIDGFIMSACALAAWSMDPKFLTHAIFCHEGEEAGHKLMLQFLGVSGLLNLGLRLGEGTGALCAYPIVESAIRMINEMNNFKDANVTQYF